MTTKRNAAAEPAGWIGGFEQSNPAFAYPNPNLTSLPLLGNLANIDLLQRQQGAKWPEFSWETCKGSADPKRCFQMFAPYISRLRLHRSRKSVFDHMPAAGYIYYGRRVHECRSDRDRTKGLGRRDNQGDGG